MYIKNVEVHDWEFILITLSLEKDIILISAHFFNNEDIRFTPSILKGTRIVQHSSIEMLP